MSVEAGSIIGQRYRAVRCLGAGGVGEVWAGVRLADDHEVAIKTLLPAAAAHRELVARFKREADLLARIRSKYVSRVIDFLSDPNHGLVLVLELAPGEPLSQVLERGPIAVEEAIDLCWDVVGGIADLHRQQIIHRDLKPGNVILQRRPGGRSHAVIIDFGMSRFAGVDHEGEEITALTSVDIAVGTLAYMAPEQILNSRQVTGAADIYALGAMLHRAVTGRHVFGDLTDVALARHKLSHDAPPLVTGRSDAMAKGFEAIVDRMLQKHPKNRYAQAEDVFPDLISLREVPSAPRASLPSWPTAPSQPFPSAPTSADPVALPTPTPVASASTLAVAPPAPAPSGRGAAVALAIAVPLALVAAAGGWLVLRRLPPAETSDGPVVGEASPASAVSAPVITGSGPSAPGPSASAAPPPSASASPVAVAPPKPKPKPPVPPAPPSTAAVASSPTRATPPKPAPSVGPSPAPVLLDDP
ncbi:MAG: serine/threonine protein kinase [Polyangiaceae bacterium]|nr:serine/threonine protein kinase [Polyangiaceae bacterium]